MKNIIKKTCIVIIFLAGCAQQGPYLEKDNEKKHVSVSGYEGPYYYQQENTYDVSWTFNR